MTTANSEADKAEAAAENAKQAAGRFSDSAGSNSGGDSGGGDSDDSSGDGDSDDSSGEPVKDIFADDEDIPNMLSKGREGQDPRDPTVDEIVKQLSKLEGEARRGAIAGLTDLINKNKNESLAEAFSKGIREFSDKE